MLPPSPLLRAALPGLDRLPAPIEGWRYEWIEGGTLANFPRGRTSASASCSNPRTSHAAPIDRRCSCGFRVVAGVADLSAYLEHHLATADVVGLDYEGGGRDAVLARVEGSGLGVPGAPYPEDPTGTTRVSRVRLLEIYAPDHLDVAALGGRYDVPVRPLADLGPALFPTLQRGPRVPNRNRIEVDPVGNYWTFFLGPHRLTLPGESILVGRRIRGGLWRRVRAVLEYGSDHLTPSEHGPAWDSYAAEADGLWEDLDLEQLLPGLTRNDRRIVARGVAWLLWSAAHAKN